MTRGRETVPPEPDHLVSFLSQHPLLIAVTAFVVGQLSMLLVLGLCTTASGESEHRLPGTQPPRAPRRRRYRVHGLAG